MNNNPLSTTGENNASSNSSESTEYFSLLPELSLGASSLSTPSVALPSSSTPYRSHLRSSQNPLEFPTGFTPTPRRRNATFSLGNRTGLYLDSSSSLLRNENQNSTVFHTLTDLPSSSHIAVDNVNDTLALNPSFSSTFIEEDEDKAEQEESLELELEFEGFSSV